MGSMAVISFIYRYLYVYNKYGNLGFEGTLLDYSTFIVHQSLAFSSINFKVPSKRLPTKPMIIYEEYRQHAMVFTMRSTSVFLMSQYLKSQNFIIIIIPIIIMLHHILVDRITYIHGTIGNTAVRSTSELTNNSTFYKFIAKLYSLYQFLALGSMLLPNERSSDLAFNAIIAIQSSAFLMTLYRKRIIRGTTHLVIYGGCLILSTFHIIHLLDTSSIIGIIIVFLCRINFTQPLNNKYILWSILLFVTINRLYLHDIYYRSINHYHQ